MKKSLTVLAGVLLLAVGSLAQAETKFAVQDAAGTKDMMVVTDTGSIGINVSNPTYKLHIVGTGDPATAALLLSSPGRAEGFLPTDSGGFSFMRNNDVSVNGGLPRANDRLGYFGFGSYVGTGNKWLAMVQGYTAADVTTTSAPAYLTFGTTDVNQVNSTERVRILANGNVGIGSTTANAKLEVNGGVRINPIPAGTVAGTCNGAYNGTLWFTKGSTTAPITADKLEICAKDASNNYSWRQIY